MKNLLVSAILLAILFASCGPRQPSNSQLILGKWDISNIKYGDEELSNKGFVNAEGWIKFHTDHTFNSEGKPQGAMDGEWDISEDDEVLTIKANQSLSQESKWDITFIDKRMTWTNETLNITIQLSKSSVKS